jgi:hypothetical protein
MPAEPEAHATRIQIGDSLPAEVAIGSDFDLHVEVACCAGCELDAARIEVTGPDGTVKTFQIAGHEGTDTAGVLSLKAPESVAEHSWDIIFPAQEVAGIPHAASNVSARLATRPHATSLAVWDMPPHVVTGERFTIKIGAKSSADCPLQGQSVEICDQSGALAGSGALRDSPWPETGGLYWTEVELIAPANEGVSSWSARFSASALETAHDDTSSQFHVAVVPPPEHTVTVKVIEKESAAPVADVQIRLGAYRGATDQSGLAQIRAGKGRYDLHIWKVGYEAPDRSIEINDDLTVQIDAIALPPEDPDAMWGM